MYAEKLMNQDFPLVTGNKRYEAFDQGKAGMLFCTVDDAGGNAQSSESGIRQNLVKLNPNAKLTIAPALSGREPSTPGNNGLIMFSKTAVKTEADLRKILEFYDKMTTPEMIDLFTYGVEGVNFKVENGVKKMIDNSNFAEDSIDLSMILVRPAFIETPSDKPMTKQINAYFKANANILVNDPTVALQSPTRDQVGGQLDKLIMDARIKYVMGQIDDAGFKKVVETWRQQGGDKIIQEFTDAYNKANAK